MVTGGEVAFWLLAPVMVLAALGLVLARKPVHSALCLAVVMICLAVQYAALEAPFLFAVQIIVYTGAILMLFLFVLMLVGVDSSDSLIETIKGQRAWAVVAGVAMAVLLIVAIGNATTTPAGLAEANTANGGNVQGLAALIFHRYVFAFEVTSALLITAAVGAMVLAFRERLTEKKTQRTLIAERMQRYADHGEHPGPLPTPGVYARHNGVDVPALLPDGTPAPTSVGDTLRNRGTVQDAEEIAASTSRTVRAIASDESGADEEENR
ncbi:NADH-quinone oxidoreductase subunit J [Propionibacteriaceae bacterium Y1685]|uniref:NADH-quinone oxidoreductase subunit J n=1 Tax=Microlunatus sp. Y1700 TaxID=3418487 RepID=UPI003B80E75E